jgi:septal ring factor EnvC (AmiA/AmiB activator)
MPDFGRCDDPACNETSVRLFDCAHHCMKMVCLQHLIDHDRLFERNKRQLENIQQELKRLYSIYSSLIDENKIRSEYEQQLDNYQKLVNQVNSVLETNSSDIEQVRSINDKLKKMINEKQKQSGESLSKSEVLLFKIYIRVLLAIVKVEPIEENSASTTNSQSRILF